jgi:hypothetical protein
MWGRRDLTIADLAQTVVGHTPGTGMNRPSLFRERPLR